MNIIQLILSALLKKKTPAQAVVPTVPVIPAAQPTPIAIQPQPVAEVKVEQPKAPVVATPVVQPTPQPAPVVQTSQKFAAPGKTRSLATTRYGAVTTEEGKLVWKDEAKWMTMFVPPAGFEHWINTASNRPVTKIYMNKDVVAPLKQALQNLKDRGLEKELKTFDGCFMLRMVRGTTDSVSTHSYALALDVNASENGLGKEPKLSKEFVKCWTDAGFSWGGNFSRKDGMHFSFGWE